MNNTISQVSFGGWFTLSQPARKVKPGDGAEMVLQKAVYHMHKGETPKHAADAMAMVTRGCAFDSYVAPEGLSSSNNVSGVQGHYDLCYAELGDAFSTQQAIDNKALSLDETLQKTALKYPEGRLVRDEVPLSNERVSELVGQYFSEKA